MTLRIMTMYEGIDEEWLNWWLKKAGPNYKITSPPNWPHVMRSNDPTSLVTATTIINLVKDGEPDPFKKEQP